MSKSCYLLLRITSLKSSALDHSAIARRLCTASHGFSWSYFLWGPVKNHRCNLKYVYFNMSVPELAILKFSFLWFSQNKLQLELNPCLGGFATFHAFHVRSSSIGFNWRIGTYFQILDLQLFSLNYCSSIGGLEINQFRRPLWNSIRRNSRPRPIDLGLVLSG